MHRRGSPRCQNSFPVLVLLLVLGPCGAPSPQPASDTRLSTKFGHTRSTNFRHTVSATFQYRFSTNFRSGLSTKFQRNLFNQTPGR